jgi:uncharacterized MAPEG superfamily protein
MSHLVELVILLTVLLFFTCTAAVGRQRVKCKIAAPATTGHPDFERAFRVQMNTLEAMATFLPSLWLASRYASPQLVGGIGLVWIAGRAWYAFGYLQDAKKRGPGFLIGTLSMASLWLIAIWGVIAAMLKG